MSMTRLGSSWLGVGGATLILSPAPSFAEADRQVDADIEGPGFSYYATGSVSWADEDEEDYQWYNISTILSYQPMEGQPTFLDWNQGYMDLEAFDEDPNNHDEDTIQGTVQNQGPGVYCIKAIVTWKYLNQESHIQAPDSYEDSCVMASA